ncbi:MAG: hypothetical protein Q6370_016550 [Candidatus Sigynarchaeota archaeon]
MQPRPPKAADSSPRRLAASPPRHLAASPPRRLAASPPRRLATSPPRRLATSPPRHLAATMATVHEWATPGRSIHPHAAMHEPRNLHASTTPGNPDNPGNPGNPCNPGNPEIETCSPCPRRRRNANHTRITRESPANHHANCLNDPRNVKVKIRSNVHHA